MFNSRASFMFLFIKKIFYLIFKGLDSLENFVIEFTNLP